MISRPKFSSAHSRAVIGNLSRPSLCAHRFRPKWPGSALSGACLVDLATIIFQEAAIFIEVSQLPDAIFSLTEFACKGSCFYAHVLGDSAAILKCHVHVAILPAAHAALSRTLAFEANALMPPLFLHPGVISAWRENRKGRSRAGQLLFREELQIPRCFR